MKTPKVSVIIPGKNSSDTIGQCIESIVKQSYQNLEVIYVDNDSSDNSIEIASGYPIEVIAESRRGSFIARNTGARNASGEILVFIDSDCIAEKEFVGKLIRTIIDGKEVSCMGSIQSAEENKWSAIEQKTFDNLIEEIKKMDYVSIAYSGNLAVKKSVFDQLHGFDEDFFWAADIEFSLRLIKAGYKIRYVADANVKHFHRTSIVTIFKRKFQQGFWANRIYVKTGGEPKEYGRMIREIRKSLGYLITAILLMILGLAIPYQRVIYSATLLLLTATIYEFTCPKNIIYITKKRTLKERIYQMTYFFGWRLGILYSIITSTIKGFS